MTRWLQIGFAALLGTAVGCVEANPNHCHNKEDPNGFCRDLGMGLPLCSTCEPSHGCVAEITNPDCTSVVGSTSAATTETSGGSTTAGSMSGSEVTSTTTAGTDESTTTSTSATASTATTTTDTTADTGSTTDDAMCGNDNVEAGELCDGPDLNGKDCAHFGFGGGMLVCLPNCEFDQSGCCWTKGQKCGILGKCCMGFTCGPLSGECQ